jgi:hypothetical protein
MQYMWVKYRFERVAEDGQGAIFTKLPNLLFFNISRTASQSGGNEVYQTEAECLRILERALEEESKDAVVEYTRQQMEKALRAMREHDTRGSRY